MGSTLTTIARVSLRKCLVIIPHLLEPLEEVVPGTGSRRVKRKLHYLEYGVKIDAVTF